MKKNIGQTLSYILGKIGIKKTKKILWLSNITVITICFFQLTSWWSFILISYLVILNKWIERVTSMAEGMVGEKLLNEFKERTFKNKMNSTFVPNVKKSNKAKA
jgi:hypothetical protein